MHNLRYRKFIEDLGWKDGLHNVNQMEFDRFDHSHAFYLVNVNRQNTVDTVARLTPIIYPNLLMDAFKENMDLATPERKETTLEISRFCSDSYEEKYIMGKIIVGLLEIGLKYDLESFVSFSNINIKARAKRFGWPAIPIGNSVKIGSEYVQALRHEVNHESYIRSKEILGLEGEIIPAAEIARCPLNKKQAAIYSHLNPK